jgi:pimeloyl-ACP methyl ester carboxylesterase
VLASLQLALIIFTDYQDSDHMAHSKSRRWPFVIVFIVVAFAGGIYWYGQPANPVMPEALAALNSDQAVTVIEGPWITFTPTGREPEKGLIFYPGGRVDAYAYAPYARDLASKGYRVVIVPMPLTLAIIDMYPWLGGERANEVIEVYPSTTQWAIAGHSLGGVGLGHFVHQYPEKIKAVAFWAAYPINDLSKLSMPMLSIWGENDELIKPRINDNWHLLPASIEKVVIAGGNHAQFGYYGIQKGDGVATISREVQQQQVIAAMQQLMEKMQ